MIVNVEEKDWSEHPAWGSDFDADEMSVDWHERIPEWVTPAHLLRIERVYECEECGKRVQRREPVDEY